MNVLLIFIAIYLYDMKYVKSDPDKKVINKDKVLIKDIQKTMSELVAKVYLFQLNEVNDNYAAENPKDYEYDKEKVIPTEGCQSSGKKKSGVMKVTGSNVTSLKPGQHKKFAYLIQDFVKITTTVAPTAENVYNNEEEPEELPTNIVPDYIRNIKPAINNIKPAMSYTKPVGSGSKRRGITDDIFNLNKLLYWLNAKKEHLSKEDVVKPTWVAYCPEGYTPLVGTENCIRS